MNKPIGLIAGMVLASVLTSCSLLGSETASEISKPGTQITQAPEPQRDPPCHPGLQCRR
jgi:hypothetical protein